MGAGLNMIYYAIPAYNEEQNLEPLIERIDEAMSEAGLTYRVVVVDDGSTDETPQIIQTLAKKFPLVTLRNDPNMGLGITLRRALKKATELAEPEDAIVTMDGDGTHDPTYVPALLKLLENGADVAIASRFGAGGKARGVSALRRLLSSGAGILLKIFFPIKGVRDYTSGFRAYSASALKQAFDVLGKRFMRETGFSVSPEIILELRSLGAAVQEIPFVLRYDLKGGESKIRIARTISQYLKLMARLKLESIRRSHGQG